MTGPEIAVIIGNMESATGAPPTPEDRIETYRRLLGDLPFEAVLAASDQAVLEHKYPTLPPIGVIRSLALALQSPQIPGPEAWRLFLAAVRRFGSGSRRQYRNGKFHDVDCEATGLASLPPAVAHAARCFGWQRLADTAPEHIGIAERDFLSGYGTLGAAAERKAIMPPAVQSVAAMLAESFTERAAPALPQPNPLAR